VAKAQSGDDWIRPSNNWHFAVTRRLETNSSHDPPVAGAAQVLLDAGRIATMANGPTTCKKSVGVQSVYRGNSVPVNVTGIWLTADVWENGSPPSAGSMCTGISAASSSTCGHTVRRGLREKSRGLGRDRYNQLLIRLKKEAPKAVKLNAALRSKRASSKTGHDLN
jgi:hypothetical protein